MANPYNGGVWDETIPGQSSGPYQIQVQPGGAQVQAWDPNAFKSVVGRDPNAQETQYYSNAGANWLDEVKKNTPGYGQTQSAPSTPQPAPISGGGQAPAYVNTADPVHQAVWNAFQAKGIQPRDQADFQYWVDHINQSGGLANGYQNSGGTGTWMDRMASANGGVGDYSSGGGGGGGSFGGGGSGFSSFVNGPQGTLMNGALGVPAVNDLYAKLMERANQSLNIDPRTDPIIRAQTDAFDAAQQRQNRNTQSAIAEQAGPGTNMEAIKRSEGEASGQATAGFQAQLADNERQARRTEIAQALSGSMGLLTSQQQMALQEELANLDRGLQYTQLGQNESQFARSLANNAYQFDINDQFRHDPISWA